MPRREDDYDSAADSDGTTSSDARQQQQHRGGTDHVTHAYHRRTESSSSQESGGRFEVVVERRSTSGGAGRRRDVADDGEADHSRRRRASTVSDSRIEGPGSSSGGRTPDSSFFRDFDTSGASGRIGDSRSIVLALRALQEKIRKLESDRDFHREQCESARRAHETYKHEVESRLERDRASFREREQDLQNLIARAKQEHSRLLRTLDDSKADLGSANSEMSTLMDRERSESMQREQRLREELENYRRQIADERLAKEQLVQQLEQARAERSIVETTNRRLEHTMKDLLSTNEKLVIQQQQRQMQAARHVDATSDSLQPPPRRAASLDGRRGGASAAALRQPPMRFQSPTLSSLQHRSSSAHNPHDHHQHHHQQVLNTSLQQQSVTLSPRRSGAPPPMASRPVALHRETADVYRGGRPLAPPARGGHISGESAAAAAQPLDDVYAALEAELRDLNKQYRAVIADANDPDSHLSHELLTAKLNGIMVQIDRKTEQLRLLRVTKADVTKEDVRSRPHVAKGYTKSTLKAKGTNNLRAMAVGSR